MIDLVTVIFGTVSKICLDTQTRLQKNMKTYLKTFLYIQGVVILPENYFHILYFSFKTGRFTEQLSIIR